MNFTKILTIIGMAAATLFGAYAQEGADSPVQRVSYEAYPFVDTGVNALTLNGDDWGPLRRRIDAVATTPFRILLIGDSHIQPDLATAVTRRTLQNRYGSAGRGLIAPLKMAGTNQPGDFELTSTTPGWQAARLLKKPWLSPMTFTGVSAMPPEGTFDLTVSLKLQPGHYGGFDRMRIYFGALAPVVDSVLTTGQRREIGFVSHAIDNGCTEVKLQRSVDGCTLVMHTAGATQIAGIELLTGYGGLEFSTIGNNGAEFSSYLDIGAGRGVGQMNPDLIILAMGTNDAWGDLSDEAFTASIMALVDELRMECPDARILLTTPAEAQKKGPKGYQPHQKIARFAELIRRLGAENHLAVYDFYTIAGGAGSSAKWVKAGLFSPDRVHLSAEGYHLMGQLLGDALIQALD